MNLLSLPARNLMSQKLRSTLTVLGIAVAVGSFVALTGLTRGLQDSYSQGVGDVGGDYVVSQRGTYSLVSSSISEELVARLDAVAGVDEAAGIVLSIAAVDEEANIFVTAGRKAVFCGVRWCWSRESRRQASARWCLAAPLPRRSARRSATRS